MMFVKVLVSENIRAIAPGQSAVLYKNNQCLGGGIIAKSFKRLAIISSMKNQDQISPLDNRYNQKIVELAENFSESNLNKTRFEIEIDWIFLTTQCGKKFPSLSSAAKKSINNQKMIFNDKSVQKDQKIESKTNHDVKAVEYFIREEIKKYQIEKNMNI